MNAFRQAGTPYGYGNKPIWFTETGWATKDRTYTVTPAQQSQYENEELDLARTQTSDVVSKVFFYTMDENCDAMSITQNINGTPCSSDPPTLPAYGMLTSYIASHPTWP